MIDIDKEVRAFLVKFGEVLKDHRDNQVNRIKGGGIPEKDIVKLYASRGGGGRCSGHFTTSTKSLQTVDWISEVIETVLGVRPSLSIVIRRALLSYQTELLLLLCKNTAKSEHSFKEWLKDLTMERDALYEMAEQKLDKTKKIKDI